MKLNIGRKLQENMDTLKLPDRFSEEAQSLFRAYQEIWSVEHIVKKRIGEPYWELCNAALFIVLQAIVNEDDQDAGNALKIQHRKSSKT
jgi:hypothetical protein